MHYIRFQLLYLQRSGECIGSFQTNSIPSRNEVLKQEYAFSPCPPRDGSLPIDPDIFMHAFLDPQDHLGPTAIDALPKKLWCKLSCDEQVQDLHHAPTGWGFYIVEGIHWGLLSFSVTVAVLAVTVFIICWSRLMDDFAGGY